MGGPIRVLHVVVNMNRGGAETLIMNLYRNIDRSKVQFDFLTCKKGVFDSEITRLGGRIYRIPYVTEIGHRKYIKSLDYFFRVHKNYKIVHSHMDKMSGFILRSAAKVKIPFRIAHSHSTRSQGGVISRLYKWYAGNFIFRNATHFMACSQKSAEWLFLEKANKALIVKNAIDCDQFMYSSLQREKIRKAFSINKNTFVVGHVGRFDHPKNHIFLIDIFKRILDVHKDSLLILIGDGELKNLVKNKVNDLRLQEHVRFLGVRNDVHLLYQAMDVFVFPSLYEGLPVTLIEAQSSGLPCLVSDHITEEVDMGIKAIRYLSLNNKMNWVESINSVRNKERIKETKLPFIQKGYEITDTAYSTQQLYLNLVR
jgi:glycosyltransferase involved in cell wall biosynthesis